MSIPLTDLNIKRVVEYTIQLVQSDPDRHLRDIFGDLRLEPNQALYGDRVIEQIKQWLATTKITVATGFDLSQTELPCVTVNMGPNSPAQQFLGDHGGQQFQDLTPQERDVVVPAFSPASIGISEDRSYATLGLPAGMPAQLSQLVLPGLSLLDAKQQEYCIGFDDLTQLPTIVPFRFTIDQGDFTQLTVVSPLRDARYRDGAMQFSETVNVDVHGHQNRNENRWLWAIVAWGLVRFRPLMISTFGMDLGVPSSSDLEMDASFQGNNVWVRRISLQAKAVWSWRGVRLQDAIGLILSVNQGRSSS